MKTKVFCLCLALFAIPLLRTDLDQSVFVKSQFVKSDLNIEISTPVFDAASSEIDAATNSVTFSHTCSGENRILIVSASSSS